MVHLTENEREALLILFKDFNTYYNANSLSQVLNISHVGVQKIFKRFKNEEITKTKKIGKSIVHKLTLEDDYVQKLISFLLVDETNNNKRWKREFEELYKNDRIVLIYGSIIKNYKMANDIDIMIILKRNDIHEVDKYVLEKNKILSKKIHCIKLTENDMYKNVKDKNKSIIDIIKNAIVLSGYDKYVGIIKNVKSF